jgi:hypothetical protein
MTEACDAGGDGLVHRTSEGGHVGTTVVRAVSEAVGVRPTDLPVELNDVVDPDAMDDLFAPRADGKPRADGRVEFELLGCAVAVHADGRVVVERVQ